MRLHKLPGKRQKSLEIFQAFFDGNAKDGGIASKGKVP